MSTKRKTALIIVDMQYDFCPGGALAVPDGDAVIPVINRLMGEYPVVVTTQDWHPANHCSFVAQGGPWPPHCVEGTHGAELHADLNRAPITYQLHKPDNPNKETYSAFEDTDLADRLRSMGVTDTVVVGLATDYCVKHTALAAKEAGFGVTVVADGCRAVNVQPDDGERAIEELRAKGVRVV
jgi:nicotinamidase/pyrazinamidase